MKIECDKCGAKYSIADDKVRGKTFKIRCKKCSNVIIVRDKAESGADEPAAAAAAPAEADHDHSHEQDQDAGGDPGWHLAIDGDTVGPLAEQEVRDRFAAGEIDGETSVWQEGFDDWLPLSEVSTFSDLASSRSAAAGLGAAAAVAAEAAPAAPDPFAGGGDDDYGAGFNEPEPEPEPEVDHGEHSPRVDDLTGARNENSVLFSLDSLSAVAMGGGAPKQPQQAAAAAPAGPTFSVAPASSAPASQTTAQGEGSGLIDIRAMSAMFGDGDGGGGGDAGAPGAESFGDSSIPSFGGGFGGLAAAPLSIDSPEKDAPIIAPEPVKSSNGPLYALIGVLALGLIGITGWMVTRPEPEGKTTEIIKIVPGAVPDDDDGSTKKKKKKSDEDDEDEDEDEDEDAVEESAGDSAAGTSTKKKSTKKKKKGTSDKTPDAVVDPKADKPKADKPKPKDDDVSVDCLLDPGKCKKSGGSGGGSGGGDTKTPPDSSLPKKLTAADIKSGYGAAKSAAQSNCKSKAKGGEKVVVKLSIEGSSGKVLSATADGSALGNCVAGEMKKAKFKKFQAQQQGAQISVRF